VAITTHVHKLLILRFNRLDIFSFSVLFELAWLFLDLLHYRSSTYTFRFLLILFLWSPIRADFRDVLINSIHLLEMFKTSHRFCLRNELYLFLFLQGLLSLLNSSLWLIIFITWKNFESEYLLVLKIYSLYRSSHPRRALNMLLLLLLLHFNLLFDIDNINWYWRCLLWWLPFQINSDLFWLFQSQS
jgi:hypothetical protein